MKEHSNNLDRAIAQAERELAEQNEAFAEALEGVATDEEMARAKRLTRPMVAGARRVQVIFGMIRG